MAAREKAPDAEIAIVGGGMAGMVLAIATARAGIPTLLIEAEAPARQEAADYDGRASAIAFGSQQVLARLDCWHRLAGAAEPILDIRVTDGAWHARGESPAFVHYHHRDLPEGHPFGWIVENGAIRRGLSQSLDALPALSRLAPARVAGFRRESGRSWLRLAEGGERSARLAVAADGRASLLRREAGIGAHRFDYGHDAIVLSVAHEKPHRNVAHEHFLPVGPFAMLPMRDDRDMDDRVRHRSSIVWTEDREIIPFLLGLDDAALGREIERRFGPTLGPIRPLGRRFAYPIDLTLAETYAKEGIALIGDAAHGLHPVAGQGFNMGIRDAAALADLLIEAFRLGLDLGSLAVLETYARRRRFDNLRMAGVTDGLTRLFSNDVAPLRAARDLGFALFNRLPPLKRLAMRQAMGVDGTLPKL